MLEGSGRLNLLYLTCLAGSGRLNLSYFTCLEGSGRLNLSCFMCLEGLLGAPDSLACAERVGPLEKEPMFLLRARV